MLKVLLAGAIAVVLPGCAHGALRNSFQFQHSLEPLEGVTQLEVSTSSGDVRVTGVEGTRATVAMRLEISAGSEERAKEIAARMKTSPPVRLSNGRLELGKLEQVGLGSFESVVVDFDVTVPYGAEVSIDSSSGDQSVSGVTGPVRVDSASGDVHVSSVAKGVRVDTASGDVTLKDVSGDVSVDASSGDIEIESAMGPGARWRLDVSSGDVRLRVPADSAFAFRASTASGGIHTDLPVKFQGELSEHRIDGAVGTAGDGRLVQIDTASGDIELRAAQSSPP